MIIFALCLTLFISKHGLESTRYFCRPLYTMHSITQLKRYTKS